MEIVIVVVMSIAISALLNKVAESKGWKKKAELYADERAYVRALPIVFIAVYLITVLVLPKIGIVLPVPVLLTIQLICISLAVFLFELFK